MTDHRIPGSVERMTVRQRIDHGLLMVILLLLISSGLALVYHEHAWAQWLIGAMGGLEGRHLVHRASAVGLILLGALHALNFLTSARYRADLKAMKVSSGDFAEGFRGWLFGLTGRGDRPRYGRFTPMQKFQYWGILAGCALMAVSGLVLWSPQLSLRFLHKSVVDVMLVIHSSQAQVIFIMLILWHLYDVHVAGGNFPMNPAWLTGRMKADLYARQHAGDAEARGKVAP